MNIKRLISKSLQWLLMAMLALPASLYAAEYGDTGEDERFSHEELTQLLAPIALYPDSLVAQVLMASTYPLEVVEADRFMRNNKGLKGAELDNALLDKDWDPSVKSMCNFPDLLASMSEKLDQTRRLGDAFLAQEDEVMSVIQELRRRAEDQGNLKSTDQQKVIVEEEIIVIEPANPEVVYVPVYDPRYVYGPWWYPAYPPYYWYFPSIYAGIGSRIGFGFHISFGFGLFSWSWFDWHTHRVHVDYDRIRRFDRPRHVGEYRRTYWRHEPRHRRGVSYRDRRTSEHFGSSPWMSPRKGRLRGHPSGELERRIRSTRPSTPQVEQRRRAIPPAAPRVNDNRGRIRHDSPDIDTKGRRLERRIGEQGGETRRRLEIGTPRRVIEPQSGRSGSVDYRKRTIERGIKPGGVEFTPRRDAPKPQSGGELKPRGRERSSPAVDTVQRGSAMIPPRPEFRPDNKSRTPQGVLIPQTSGNRGSVRNSEGGFGRQGASSGGNEMGGRSDRGGYFKGEDGRR